MSKPTISSREARPGQILVVIHEFKARTADELGLKKGDRVELIERDDDFGDGWYLGRHEQNGSTGLFPEVYTRLAPVQPPKKSIGSVSSNNGESMSQGHRSAPVTPVVTSFAAAEKKTSGAAQVLQKSSPDLDSSNFVSPGVANSSTYPLASPKSVGSAPRSPGDPSGVMNETLNHINEAMANMNRPLSSSGKTKDRRTGNESGSEYSGVAADESASYIQGHETDEEERAPLTKAEVMSWSPAQVAEYFDDLGVEKPHCDFFLEQEISGDVILEMDDSTWFHKGFAPELGVQGRRMRTWFKIRALQQELKSSSAVGSVVNSKASWNSRTDETSDSAAALPVQYSDLRDSRDPKSLQALGNILAEQAMGSARPSAASIRDLGHARRYSSMDSTNLMPPPSQSQHATLRKAPTHTQNPSLDRTWTMGAATDAAAGISVGAAAATLAPKNTSHVHSMSSDSHASRWRTDSNLRVNTDADKGYLSSSETEARRTSKKLTKGRTISQDTTHRRKFSDNFKRASRADSNLSHDDHWTGSSGPTLYSAYRAPRSRSQSQSGIRTVSAPLAEGSPEDDSTPAVTKLEYDNGSPTVVSDTAQTPSSMDGPSDKLSPRFGRSFASRKSIRAISDAVTGREKSSAGSATIVESPQKKMIVESPTTGTSTPSAASQSFDFDTQQAQTTQLAPVVPPAPSARRGNKSKKTTSAYTRGLQKKTPQEQMDGCDYSGWMKKKSSNLMTTWKPRLFVLRGRRLSYYYSEHDTEEKGLIDISSHRVLPADNDFLTGLHATLTGVGNSPSSPPVINLSGPSSPVTATSGAPGSAGGIGATPYAPTTARSRAASASSQHGSKDLFIFKLVPPRSGLSRAVNFTKPTVHYFAVNTVEEGRLWMAAFMKATIDRDETKEVVTTYQHKTISLAKARARRELPPFLGGVDEVEEVDRTEDMTEQTVGSSLRNSDEPEEGLHDSESFSNSSSANPPIIPSAPTTSTAFSGASGTPEPAKSSMTSTETPAFSSAAPAATNTTAAADTEAVFSRQAPQASEKGLGIDMPPSTEIPPEHYSSSNGGHDYVPVENGDHVANASLTGDAVDLPANDTNGDMRDLKKGLQAEEEAPYVPGSNVI